MNRYNRESEKLKHLYLEPYTLLKAYIFSCIMALIITLPMFLIIINIVYLVHYLNYVLLIIIITCLLLCYLILYFKDKYLLMNVEGAKDINLFLIRIVDILIITVFMFALYGLYLLIRR